MKIRVKIGDLVETVAKFQSQTLHDNQEIHIDDLGISVPTTSGTASVQAVIKKQADGREIVFANGHRLRCADRHILFGEQEIFAKDLAEGAQIRTAHGDLTVVSNNATGRQDFYDIGVPEPHQYYDAAGILHHNTIITAALSWLIEPYGRSIVIVPSKSLVTQTEADYRNTGLDVGVFYGDRKEWGHKHTICTWQSLSVFSKKSRKDEGEISIMDFIEGVTCVIIDEVHSAAATELRNLLCGPFAHIPIRWGLTGTIPKAEHEAIALLASIGPIVGELRASELQKKGVIADCNIKIVETNDKHVAFADYDSEHKYLMTDKTRQRWMASYIETLSKTGNTLVLVDRIETGNELQALIPESVFVSGTTKTKDRKKEYDEIQITDNKVIIATYGVASVGLNIPRLFNCVLIQPGKSFVRVVQSIGRILRRTSDKTTATIIDLTSNLKFSKRHLTKRKEYYKEAEYPFTMTKVDY